MTVLLVIVLSREVREPVVIIYATPPLFCEQQRRGRRKRERAEERNTQKGEKKEKGNNVRMFLQSFCHFCFKNMKYCIYIYITQGKLTVALFPVRLQLLKMAEPLF